MEEVDFLALFSRLKEHPDNPHSKRIELILDLLSRLGDDGLGKEETASALAGLRKALGVYRWVSQVSLTRQGLRTILVPADRENLSWADRWEYGAVNDLLSLLRDRNALSRLRRCADAACKSWIYANGRQQFCNRNCKQHHHETDPEKHAQKLMRMKRLYRDEQACALKAKNRVRLELRVRAQ